MSFAKRLKSLRESRGLSQRELAKLLNIGASTLGMYEIGEREPDYNMLKVLADFFGVSTDYLLGRDNEQPLEAQSDTHRRMDNIGASIRKYREAKHLSLRELGKQAHISHSFIADIESGRSKPSLDTLGALAKTLGVSIMDLTGETDTHRRIEAAIADDPDAEELLAFWKEMKEREDLQLLFKQVRPLSDDSIRRVIRIIKAIEDEEDREFNS